MGSKKVLHKCDCAKRYDHACANGVKRDTANEENMGRGGGERRGDDTFRIRVKRWFASELPDCRASYTSSKRLVHVLHPITNIWRKRQLEIGMSLLASGTGTI